jgi:homocitrate synthase NifV
MDTTLREGLQRAGAYLEPRARRVLADDLVASGIDELEIGVVGRDAYVPSLLSGLLAKHPHARFWVWSRLRTSDVEEACAMGARSIALCAPVSPEHLQDRLGWSRSELHDRIRLIVGFAVEMGLEVSVGLEDASRTPEDAMLEAARTAVEAGAIRVRMADTVGVFSPAETAQRTLSLRSLGCQVGFHGHDDFGMATANAVAALEAGAYAADSSLMGWGERAGIAATERLGAFLALRRGAGLDIGRLCKAARDLAGRCGVRISETAPVLGEALFRCETGLHVAALAEHPSLYEPYEPELVGAKRDLLVGGKSGAQAVSKLLSKIRPEIAAKPDLVDRVRREAERLGRPLEERELVSIASSPAP